MTSLIVQHSTERSTRLMIPVPPKTERGRWKMVALDLDEHGRTTVSKDVWEKELRVALNSGLLSGQLRLMGRDPNPPKTQVLTGGPDTNQKPVRVEQRQGIITATPAQLQQMLYDAKRQRRVLGNTERPKSWS